LSLNQAAAGQISTLRWQKTRWCLVRVPNQALACQAGLDESALLDMFFNACLLDWDEENRKWLAWTGRLNQGRQVHLVGKETDLRFSTEGRTWIIGDGRNNMPDGEINTAPVENTVDGYIFFEFPGVLSGRLVNDIRLRWEHGQLVEAISSTNQDFLRSILATDPGASLIGEFALGTNPFVNLFCKDILIDEKIGGTIHIALGRAYPESGGTNQSAIHWDIIKDTRSEGAVYVDNQLVLYNGQFLF
jgi:aminopeptidase